MKVLIFAARVMWPAVEPSFHEDCPSYGGIISERQKVLSVLGGSSTSRGVKREQRAWSINASVSARFLRCRISDKLKRCGASLHKQPSNIHDAGAYIRLDSPV
jgi:hypothetical protein